MLVLFAALALDALLNAPTLHGAHVGALVADATTGNVLYERDADDAFVPASVMKLIVGSAALEVLGPDFSFTTTLATDDSRLYLRGGGDPLLSQADAGDAARTVAALHLTAFPGGLDGDSSWDPGPRYPDGWQIDDLPYDYAAPISAISLGENRIHISVSPATPGQPATLTITPQQASDFVVNATTTGGARTEDTIDLSTSWNRRNENASDAIVVTGSIPSDARSPDALDGAMLRPPLVALDVFRSAFTEAGISVGETTANAVTPANARVLWQHHSPRLGELLGDMWKPSDNLLAETLFHEIGASREHAWLHSIGVDDGTLTIADGSGMSAYDRVTPRALVAILAHDWTSPSRPIVLAALPVAGKSGTLEDRFKGTPLEGIVIAKTGTVNHTRTLAGYLETPHGTRIFALLVNDWMDSGPDAAKRLYAVQEQFLERIRESPSGVP